MPRSSARLIGPALLLAFAIWGLAGALSAPEPNQLQIALASAGVLLLAAVAVGAVVRARRG